VEVARGELVEKDLDAMIERRSRNGDTDPDEREELWKESLRAHNVRRSEENRLACPRGSEGPSHVRACAREERYAGTTISLLGRCHPRPLHTKRARGWREPRRGSNSDTYTDLVKRKCQHPCLHATQEGSASRRANGWANATES
jgi:hypothetical protein